MIGSFLLKVICFDYTRKFQTLFSDKYKRLFDWLISIRKLFITLYYLLTFYLAAPVSPTLRKDLLPTIIPPKEGENYTLSCDFNGTPTPAIAWLRNGFLQTTSDRFIFTDNNRNMHMINTNHVFHNGQYQCEGSNSAGRTRSSKLTVQFACKSYLTFFIGSLTFGCNQPGGGWLTNTKSNKSVAKNNFEVILKDNKGNMAAFNTKNTAIP